MKFSYKRIKCILVITSIFLFWVVASYYLESSCENEIVKENNYFEKVFLVGNIDSLQKIKLFEMEEDSYYAFIPSEMRTDVYIQFEEFKEVQIGDVFYRSGDELSDIYKGEPYVINLLDDKGNLLETASLKFVYTVDVPTIYIE